jgi:excinuclease ABC subunit C
VQVLFVREARVLGSRSYYPRTRLDESPEAILEAFLPQFYLSGQQQIPQEIVVSHPVTDSCCWRIALATQSGRKVLIKQKVRDRRARWLEMAAQNAQNNLRSFLAGKQTMAGQSGVAAPRT